MIKKIRLFLLGVLVVVFLAVGLWALALYEDWPLSYVAVTLVGIIVFVIITRWVGRRWHTWRLRLRMNSELTQSRRDEAANLDQDWKAGVQLLRDSRLGRMGAPLYALPWFLMLGESGNGKSRLLQHGGLTSELNSLNRDGQTTPTGTLNWWFLKRGVVLDPAERLAQSRGDGGAEWRRLLYWLLRSRRREPLNGLLLVIDTMRLLSGSDESLAEQGEDLRRCLNDLVKVFEARLPVYFIITGAEVLPGLTQWGAGLTPAHREQPFGLLSKQSDSGAASFLDEMFDGIIRRLFDLRIELGVRGLPDSEAFSLPERIGALRPQLEKLLLPAFSSNPYNEPPLLSGLFLTAQRQVATEQCEGWFSHDLFDRLLYSQRYAYLPIDSWRRWRRLLAHTAMIAWLALCVGFGALMTYANHHTKTVLSQALNSLPTENDFAGGLETDLDASRRFHLELLNLSRQHQQGWQSLLPFSSKFDEMIQRHRADYVGLFSREVETTVFNEFISKNLNHILNAGDSRMIAACAEFLVRRINLLDARLNNQSMEGLPLPGNELGILNLTYGSKEKISAGQIASLGESYRQYLEWETDINRMQIQRTSFLVQLDNMSLEHRPLDWLTAWADQQGELPPILIGDYLTGTDIPNLRISGAYTFEGHRAILGFFDEVGRASRDQELWKDRRVAFLQQYSSNAQDIWYSFIKGGLLSAQARLKTRSDWQQFLSVVGTSKDPFIRLLSRSAERFALISMEHRKPWANRAVEMDRLLKLAANYDLHTELGLLGNFNVTNALGRDVLKGMVSGISIERGVKGSRDELSQARALARFQQLMTGVVDDLQKNDAQAFQVALDTWGEGQNSNVKAAPLWEADRIRKTLIPELNKLDGREDVAWSMVTAQLDFSLHYVAEVAACRLQSDWSGQLLSVIEGIRDPVMLNELLYGDRGQLSAFMNGPVKTFIQRDVQRYTGRESSGVQIPLTDAFYSYVSRMQHAQNHLASALRQNQIRQETDQQSKHKLEAEQKTLATQRAELKQNIATLSATAAVVELTASPSLVNISARSLPRQTRLTLQCSDRSTVLDNFNFPTSATFVWAPGACSSVSLEISFANFKLTRYWNGDLAFLDFLRMFNGGQHTFTPDDFPRERNIMRSENLSSIQLTYRQEGEQVLLEKYAQADQLQMQLSVIDEQLNSINDKLMTMGAQAAAMNVGLIALGSTDQQVFANIQPPAQIARCSTF